MNEIINLFQNVILKNNYNDYIYIKNLNLIYKYINLIKYKPIIIQTQTLFNFCPDIQIFNNKKKNLIKIVGNNPFKIDTSDKTIFSFLVNQIVVDINNILFIRYITSVKKDTLNTSYLYNAISNSFIFMDILPLNAKQIMSALILPSGCILLFCFDGNILTSFSPIIGCEKWSREKISNFKNNWIINSNSPIKKYLAGKNFFNAIVLMDGNILISGGGRINKDGVRLINNSVFIYNHINDTFKTGAKMLKYLKLHNSILLPNGHVLVMGGLNDGFPTRKCQKYNPYSDKWIYKKSLLSNKRILNSFVINHNIILVVHTNNFCEYYNILKNTWSEMSPPQITGLKRKNF